ncbi:hypothetical protein RJ639_035630 [Escallonia herrerae]|uniref:ATP-dependent Zn protease n=1 Tax=Escallonia herrerae TaxID=1293975 RepID=A0AA88WS07_9ASTE|nr:hypothetical protein RJ639_035630 [Escallonia herrerae]
MYCSIHHVPSFAAAAAFRYRQEVWARQTVALTRPKDPDSVRRRRALRRVDRELSKGNFKTALSLVKQLQGQPGGLRGFGAAKQVSRKILYLDELKLHGTEVAHLRSLLDSIMDSITRGIQLSLLDEGSVLRLEDLMHGESYDSPIEDLEANIKQHEAGHFLVGYLLGVLPKRYTISSTEALREDTLTGGRVEFLGFEFLGEVSTFVTTFPTPAQGILLACGQAHQR